MSNLFYPHREGRVCRSLHCILFALALSVIASGPLRAQGSNSNHLTVGVSALYERGFDATVAYEHETRYHHAWEYFVTGYLKYQDDPVAGHVTAKSFWDSYDTWHVGIAYKPCVSRGRNHHGNARLGVSGGSDRHRFVGGIHVGYEHSYALKHGWQLFFQVKEDVIIRGDDLFRTGVAVGVKVPL
jgi:hypothetical protein